MNVVTLQQSLNTTVRDVTKRYEKGGVDFIGIPTGFHKIDKALSGLRRQAVYVVGARSSIGKSAFAVSVGLNVAKSGHKVLYLSFEMGADLLSLRILSGLTGIPSEDIERGRLTRKEHERLIDVQRNLSGISFSVNDDMTNSEALVDAVQKHQEENGLDMLIVDYIGLFRDANVFGDVERLGRISNNINTIAHVCDIPVIALSQLNREADKRDNHTPILSDLRSSGDIEQDAFAVLLLTRPHYYAMMYEGAEPVECESDAQIIIAKNRQGVTGLTRANFYPRQMRWEQPEPILTQPRRVGQ